MSTVIVRMWTKEGYHKDVIIMNEQQVSMGYVGTECGNRHLVAPIDATRVVIDPTLFPEAVEFEVIVKR
jgi:urease accessory protein UreE